jgi:hypothetical protein
MGMFWEPSSHKSFRSPLKIQNPPMFSENIPIRKHGNVVSILTGKWECLYSQVKKSWGCFPENVGRFWILKRCKLKKIIVSIFLKYKTPCKHGAGIILQAALIAEVATFKYALSSQIQPPLITDFVDIVSDSQHHIRIFDEVLSLFNDHALNRNPDRFCKTFDSIYYCVLF